MGLPNIFTIFLCVSRETQISTGCAMFHVEHNADFHIVSRETSFQPFFMFHVKQKSPRETSTFHVEQFQLQGFFLDRTENARKLSRSGRMLRNLNHNALFLRVCCI